MEKLRKEETRKDKRRQGTEIRKKEKRGGK